MGPARPQWLAAFTLALLLHVAAGMALITFWQERPRVPATAGAGGVEVALFAGFERALREAAIESPGLAGAQAAPLEPLLAPTQSAPVEPFPALMDHFAEVADAVPVETPEAVAPAVAEAPLATPAIAPVDTIDLAVPLAHADPSPLGVVPSDILPVADAIERIPLAPTEAIPVLHAADSVAVADAPAPFDWPQSAADAAQEAAAPRLAPEAAQELPTAPASSPDLIGGLETTIAHSREIEIPEALAMAPMEIIQAREPEPTPIPAQPPSPQRDVAEETSASETAASMRAMAQPEASAEGMVAAAPAPSPTADDRQGAEQAARPGIEAAYLAALQARLERYKDYPRLAQRRGEEGTVLLRFTINRHGMVIEHAIVQSSGHTSLDNSVEHMIRRAQPLPAIPFEMGRDWIQVILPVQFQLER
jgi:protein TonB